MKEDKNFLGRVKLDNKDITKQILSKLEETVPDSVLYENPYLIIDTNVFNLALIFSVIEKCSGKDISFEVSNENNLLVELHFNKKYWSVEDGEGKEDKNSLVELHCEIK